MSWNAKAASSTTAWMSTKLAAAPSTAARKSDLNRPRRRSPETHRMTAPPARGRASATQEPLEGLPAAEIAHVADISMGDQLLAIGGRSCRHLARVIHCRRQQDRPSVASPAGHGSTGRARIAGARRDRPTYASEDRRLGGAAPDRVRVPRMPVGDCAGTAHIRCDCPARERSPTTYPDRSASVCNACVRSRSLTARLKDLPAGPFQRTHRSAVDRRCVGSILATSRSAGTSLANTRSAKVPTVPRQPTLTSAAMPARQAPDCPSAC